MKDSFFFSRATRQGYSILVSSLLILFSWVPVKAETLPAQVLIEAQIWELSDDFQMNWGVIWDYDKKESSPAGDFDIFSADLRLPLLQESGEAASNGLFASADVFDLRYGIMNLRIQAALREGRAELLANPKVVVLNGKQATIHTGEQVPFIEFDYVGGLQAIQNLKTSFRDTGVKLTVRADIHKASPEFVLLSIRPEVTEITQFETIITPEGDFELPRLTTRTADSKVLVRSGETLVMGGLYQEQSIQVERGVPGLKDVPWAGSLFKNKSQIKEKRDLLIELRPTVLLPGRASFYPAPFSASPRLTESTDVPEIKPNMLKLPLIFPLLELPDNNELQPRQMPRKEPHRRNRRRPGASRQRDQDQEEREAQSSSWY